MAINSKRLIPLAAMEQIMKQAGAERVSDKAKAALKEVLEEYAKTVAADAVKFALHAGRKTVKAGDIKLAVKK
jgi:histone H3/H4